MKKLYILNSNILNNVVEWLCISKISLKLKTPIIKFLIRLNIKLLKRVDIYD